MSETGSVVAAASVRPETAGVAPSVPPSVVVKSNVGLRRDVPSKDIDKPGAKAFWPWGERSAVPDPAAPESAPEARSNGPSEEAANPSVRPEV